MPAEQEPATEEAPGRADGPRPTPGEVSRTRAWIMAMRPHVKPAGASPVIVGTAMALHDGVFALWPALAALFGALLIQTGTDLANDYYDFAKGVDTDESSGYVRVSQSGLIPAKRVLAAALGCFGVAFLIGIYLVAIGGVPIVVVGLASIASGLAYSGGPYPIGYHGLGDLFTFVFFGLVAVSGTYYVQAASLIPGQFPSLIPGQFPSLIPGQFSSLVPGQFPLWIPPGTLPLEVIMASLPMAGLVTNILVVNNIRDIEDDARAGKRTLAVILGYRGSRAEYVLLVALAYAVPVWFLLKPDFGVAVLLPFLSLPLAYLTTRMVLTGTETEELNPALERTGQLVFAFAALFAVGILL